MNRTQEEAVEPNVELDNCRTVHICMYVGGSRGALQNPIEFAKNVRGEVIIVIYFRLCTNLKLSRY